VTPDFEQAGLVAEALEDLKLNHTVRQIEQGLMIKKPSAKITLIRVKTLKAKLKRAERLLGMLEAVLK
jgi:hypothetical protein